MIFVQNEAYINAYINVLTSAYFDSKRLRGVPSTSIQSIPIIASKPPNDMTSLRARAKRAGFSLAELLVVITIIAVLSAAGGPAFTALTSSGSANQNISQLSGILEQAREYAVAQNTYVWVAFYNSTASNGTSQVSVAVIASTDGTDPASLGGVSSWQTYGYGAAPGAGLALVSKIVTLKQLNIESATSVSPSSLPTVTPPVTSSANSINNSTTNNSTGFFSIQLPGTSTPVSFIQGVQFTPSGQARNSSSPVNVIDLDLQPQKGTTNDTKNVAVLRMNGLTGETVVYR